MSRYLGWLANGILFVIGCFLIADTANAIFAAVLAPAATAEVDVVAAPPTTARGWNDRRVILDRNLFDAALSAPAGVAVEEPEELEATQLPLVLLATVASNDPAVAAAAIHDQQTGEDMVVHANDEVKNQAVVLRIERRRIVLSENGAPRELALDEEQVAAEPPVTRARPRAAARPRASGNRDRAARIRAARAARRARAPATPPETPTTPTQAAGAGQSAVALITTDGRPEPHFDGDQMVGVQISNIRPGGLYARLGVVENDVITEVNGISADRPDNVSRILETLSQAEDHRVVVVRNGETITLSESEE